MPIPLRKNSLKGGPTLLPGIRGASVRAVDGLDRYFGLDMVRGASPRASKSRFLTLFRPPLGNQNYSIFLPLVDNVNSADAQAFTPTIVLTDTGTLTNQISKGASKILADSVSLAEAISFAFALQLQDSGILSDTPSKAVALIVADALALSDAGGIFMDWGVSLSDGITLSEQMAKSVTKGLADAINSLDANSKSVLMVKSDGVTATDLFRNLSNRRRIIYQNNSGDAGI